MAVHANTDTADTTVHWIDATLDSAVGASTDTVVDALEGMKSTSRDDLGQVFYYVFTTNTAVDATTGMEVDATTDTAEYATSNIPADATTDKEVAAVKLKKVPKNKYA